jgi:glutathione S-transferase
MKLYDASNPGTRATRVRWLLEELGVPYDRVVLDFAKGDMRTEAHLARHPHGRIPAFEWEGLSLIESGAMCMHLADVHHDKGLAPEPGTKERALWYQWICYAVSTLDDPLVARIFHSAILPEDKRNPAIVDKGDALWGAAAPFIRAGLGEGDWLVGDRFSAADVVVGYDVALAANMKMLEDDPKLGAYFARLSERPAFKAAYAP